MPELKPGDVVLMKLDSEKLWKDPVQVKSEDISPSSFMVQAPNGEGGKRRNRRQLQSVPAEYPNAEITVQSQQTLGEAHIRNASQPESRTPSKTQGETVTRKTNNTNCQTGFIVKEERKTKSQCIMQMLCNSEC